MKQFEIKSLNQEALIKKSEIKRLEILVSNQVTEFFLFITF
jgi:hypothetical protein